MDIQQIMQQAQVMQKKMEEMQAKLADMEVEGQSGGGVVVVVDMFGGSPSNLSLMACRAEDRRILYGANLPLLIKLAKCRCKPLADAVSAATEAGRKYIDSQTISPN